jgi:hypothetical protein
MSHIRQQTLASVLEICSSRRMVCHCDSKRPNLEQYKKLAKDLVKTCKAGNPDCEGEDSITIPPLLLSPTNFSGDASSLEAPR